MCVLLGLLQKTWAIPIMSPLSWFMIGQLWKGTDLINVVPDISDHKAVHLQNQKSLKHSTCKTTEESLQGQHQQNLRENKPFLKYTSFSRISVIGSNLNILLYLIELYVTINHTKTYRGKSIKTQMRKRKYYTTRPHTQSPSDWRSAHNVVNKSLRQAHEN